MIEFYGIPNCDTVKRARAWLDGQAIPYRFHDFKKEGVPAEALRRWIASLGWEALVNRRGTTWRALDDTTRAGVVDADSAARVLAANPSLVKRPVVEWAPGPQITAGFDAQAWRALGERPG